MSVDTTPEDQPPPPRKPLLQQLREAPATAAILAACIVVFIAAERAGSTKEIATLLRFGAVSRTEVWDGQYWRLATSMFLHIGAMHLFWNWWFGFKICAATEGELGSGKFLALYLGSGVVGAAVSVIGHEAVSAGASGALFGLIGWRLVSLRLQLGSWRAFTQHPAIRRELIWIGAWFVLGAFLGFDNYAHGGGMLFGALFSWALGAGGAPRPIRRRRWATAIGVGVVLVAASLRPLPLVHAQPAALRKAAALIQSGRFSEAVGVTDALLAKDPRNVRALLYRGTARYNLGDQPGAQADFDQAVEVDPSPWVRNARQRFREHQQR